MTAPTGGPIRCAERELLAVSDDPRERARAAAHAVTCPDCAAAAEADARLAGMAAAWKQASPMPPSGLARRVRATLTGRGEAGAGLDARGRGRTGWLALAAAVLIAAVLVYAAQRGGSVPEIGDTSGLLVADAMREAEQAERVHAEAIARLATAAAPILTRVGDPSLPAQDAAVLLAFRDRLTELDRTIADVGRYIVENPGNASARTVLLAAYREKTQLLQQVLALPVKGA